MDHLLVFFAGIRWQDIADVLLNSYILFRLYVLFRGTNVIRVIAGIALLWIFQQLAVSLGLIVTSWAMQGIIAGAALIIIIVFRNEIRNVLQAKNLRALLWDFPQKSVPTPIDSIIEGVYELAHNRIGALIVFPGKENLEETVKGGVPWHGLVSKQMLVSIFWNGNPVHDGAAVVEGDRVTRVGAILPLSQRDDLPQQYGTRHRAAAGLSEQTDALVIAVSEERGQVVATKNSIILDVEDNPALKHVLGEHLGAGSRKTEVSRRERRDLGFAAAVCILCMTAVWFSFARGMETLTSIEVPLEYMNRDARMQILRTSVNSVRLYLSGSTTLISSLRPEQVKAKLDLGSAVNGKNSYMLARDNIVLPPGVRLNRIEPAQVIVDLDVPVSKPLPIQVDWVGSLDDNLILESVSVQPEQAEVVGSARTIDSLSTIYTEKVSLDQIRFSGRLSVQLALDPPGIKIADRQADKVEIHYTVRKRKV